MRIEGTERKRFNKKLDESVLEWIHEIHSTGLRVSRKLIMKKAIVIHDDMVTEGESNEDFKASTGWLNGFMTHYGLALQRKTQLARKDQDQLIDKLVSFVLHVHRLTMKHPYDVANTIAMDEALVLVDMVSATTVDDAGKRKR